MKKLILAAVSASAMLALSACGDAADEPVDETATVGADTTAPLPAETPLTDDATVTGDAMADDATAPADEATAPAGEETPAEEPAM